MSDSSTMRQLVFAEQSVELARDHDKRKQGRPRKTWSEELHKHSLLICGTSSLQSIILDKNAWQRHVQKYMAADLNR